MDKPCSILYLLISVKSFKLFKLFCLKKNLYFIAPLGLQQNWEIYRKISPYMLSLCPYQHHSWEWNDYDQRWTYIDTSSSLKAHSLHYRSLLVLYIQWVCTCIITLLLMIFKNWIFSRRSHVSLSRGTVMVTLVSKLMVHMTVKI